jgi:hypothetical protein
VNRTQSYRVRSPGGLAQITLFSKKKISFLFAKKSNMKTFDF